MTKKQKGTEATRKRILDATLQCLAESGYRNTSTVDVCRKAEIARGTLLYYYGTKHELACAAIEEALTIIANDVQACFPSRGDGELFTREQTKQLMKVLSSDEFFVWLEFIIVARTDRELRKHVRKLMKKQDAHLAAVADSIVPGASEPMLFVALPLLVGWAVSTIFKPRKDAHRQQEVLQALAHQLMAIHSVDEGRTLAALYARILREP